MSWYSRPIFVSSTFRDMQAERDHLRDVVFPELAERLRARRCHLEPIDLRWGVETISTAEQEAKELLVLKVCLDEIERCRPFLIVLLGDRYGWVPPEKRIQAAVAEKGFVTSVQGKSVTALEIEFGILDSPDQKKRSFFYFRDPLPYDEMPPDKAAAYSDLYSREPGAKEAWQRLQDLKERIIKEMGPERVRHYKAGWDDKRQKVTGLDDWGRQVLEDLWNEVDEQTRALAEAPALSWQEQERAALEEFIENRCRDFVGRSEILSWLREIALSGPEVEDWGIVLTGGPGTGKSAIFARLVRELERQDCLVLAHAAGISVRAGDIEAMLRRWNQELAKHLDISDKSDEAESLSETQKLFAELLSRAAVDKRVICLIDALNQFERTPTARHLTWLPELWPKNARLVATAIPGEETESLRRRSGISIFTLPPLDDKEAADIARTICGRYHKALSPDVVEALTCKKQADGTLSAGNPLWLTIAIEELLLLDEDDFTRAGHFPGTPEEQLHALLLDVVEKLPPTVEEIYGYLLKRAERRFGEDWVRGVLDFLAASRQGLREEDFRRLLPELTGSPWEDLRFAVFRRYLRAHLLKRGRQELWDFTHAQLRICLRKERLSEPARSKDIHRRLADHFEGLTSDDPLRQTELMYHYYHADEKQRAAAYYGGSLTQEEAAGATTALRDAIVKGMALANNPGLEWTLGLLKTDGLKEELIGEICNRFNFYLLDALADHANLTTRINLMDGNRQTIEELHRRAPDSADYARGLSISYERLGDLYEHFGEPDRALQYHEKALEIVEELHCRAPESALFAHDLSVSYNRLGDLYEHFGEPDRALEYYKKALEISEELHRRAPDSAKYAHDLSVIYSKLGDLYEHFGEPDRALEYYEKDLKISEELHRRAPDSALYVRDLASACYNIAACYWQQDNKSEAVKYLALCKKVLLYMKQRGIPLDPQLEELLKQLGG